MKLTAKQTAEIELAAAQAELKELKDRLSDLQSYLQLPKFYDDTTVQVEDIYRRIWHARNCATDAGMEAGNEVWHRAQIDRASRQAKRDHPHCGGVQTVEIVDGWIVVTMDYGTVLRYHTEA